MYAKHFGLKHEPFSIAPDPRYLFMSEQHREALAHLLYGVGGGGGFVLLTGEVGAGKTTVFRCFLEQVPKRCNVAYIFNPKLTVSELLKSICDEFGVEYEHQGPGVATVKDYLDPLNEFLLATHAVGKANVLIIDEAQNLSPDVLEQLRLLTNLETTERKLLQIVLIGQPELRDMLARPELEQLAQRVIARFHLEALSEAETARYLRHRLQVAGLSTKRPFDRKAMKRIHQLARGIPRRINLLADRALLGAYASGKARADTAIVDKAAGEVFGRREFATTRLSTYPRPALLGGGLVAGALLFALVSWGIARMAGGDGGKAEEAAMSRTSPTAVAAVSGAPSSASAPLAASVGAAAQGNPGAPVISGAVGSDVAPVVGTGNANANANTGGAVTAAAKLAAGSAPVTGTSVQPSSPPRLDSAAAVSSSEAATARPVVAVASSAATPAVASAPAAALASPRGEREAWRELAGMWNLPVANGNPCDAAAQRNVQCFKGMGTLDVIRQLNRPAILTLKDSSDRPMVALLTGLSEKTATLRVTVSSAAANGSSQSVQQNVSLVSLSRMWSGEFATLWRTPAGYTRRLSEGNTGPAVQYLAVQLASLQGAPVPANPQSFDGQLKSQVSAFQLAQGLKPDGIAGPTTFMQLNRATGVDEPRLQSGG